MNWLDTLLSLPNVCDFLLSDEWTWDFPPTTIERGNQLSESGKVLAVDHFIGSQSGFVGSARVQGSRVQPYKVRVNGRLERGEWLFWGECSCPVGDDCKHVAAFAMDLQKAIRAERHLSEPEGKHDLWLSALSTVLVPEKRSAKPAQPTRKTAALAFVILPREDGFLQVGFGKIAYPTKDGLPRVENDSFSPNIRSRVPGYFQEGDAELTFALQNRIPKSPDSDHYWYEVRVLQGTYSESLLPQLLASGRLFLAEEFAKSRNLPFPSAIAEGPPLSLGVRWEVLETGDCRPSIGLPSSSVRLIMIDGPHYLDLAKHLIGPVEIAEGQTSELLQLWSGGPTVSAEEAVRLTADMEGRGIPLAIPRPVTLEEKKLEYDKVTPVLTISRSPVLESLRQPAYGGAVRVAVPPLPTAALSFRYADREVPFDPAFPEHSRFASGGYLLVIERDMEAEASEVELLDRLGIVPLSTIFDAESIDKKYRYHFGVDDEIDGWDFIWAGHVAQTFSPLKEAGWEIRYESSFDLSVTDAADIFTDLTEDPDKGIDWFQFDTGIVTNEGQRQSLMELIANFLRSNDEIPEDEAFEDDDQRVLLTDGSRKSFFNLPAKRFFRIVRSVRDLFDRPDDGLHRLEAAAIAEELELDESKTLADLRALGEQLRKKEPHLPVELPSTIKAELRDYQKDGFQWLQFLARHHLHGILADDMGLGKTLQALAHIAAEVKSKRHEGHPSLVVAPTSVVPNWAAEARKFAPSLKVLVLHGSDRQDDFKKIDKHHIVITSYALLQRDQAEHRKHTYHLALLDEAQFIKNPKAKVSIAACKLDARHRLCLSGTPMENHLGELWSLVRFLMPGLLGTEQTFNKIFRTPIERHHDGDAQRVLNARVGNLILRRTKDQVVLELPAKTVIIHRIALNKEQQEIYESVRTAMDSKVRDAIADKGLARSQIIVLDALLKLRQVCCHPQLIKTEIAKKAKRSAKLDFLVELLATLIEEGRRILLFSQFTTMLAMIEDHLIKEKIKYVKITGATRDRKTPVEEFQKGETPVFLISLKAGGTGLNLTAADTVIHYDPWWNPAAENQATDRAHRIGQTNPVFVHKLVSEGSIEERILDLQARKSKLVEALLSEETSKLKLDTETLGNLLAPIDV